MLHLNTESSHVIVTLMILLLFRSSPFNSAAAIWATPQQEVIAGDFTIDNGGSMLSIKDTLNSLQAQIQDLSKELNSHRKIVDSCDEVSESGEVILSLSDFSYVPAYCIVGLFNHTYVVVAKAHAKYPASDMLYNHYDDDNQARLGIEATSDFSIPVRYLKFKPSELIMGSENDFKDVFGHMYADAFVQAKAYSTASADNGACTTVDAFYSPDWYANGLQYGFHPNMYTNGLGNRRAGTGGIDLAGSNCSSSGYLLAVFRGADDHVCLWGICNSYNDVEAVNSFKTNYVGVELFSSVYSAHDLQDTTVGSATRPSGLNAVWVAVRA